jgi:hypothetical protein
MDGWFAKNNFRRRQNIGLIFGLIAGTMLVLWLALPSNTRLHAPGLMNVGHEKLECEDCHLPTAGSLRQKLQADVRYWLGERESFVPLGHVPVTNEHCLECHERPNERHPVFRFFEPRFKKARAEIGAQYCVSCHREHTGVRVTADLRFCEVCHQNLNLKNDPLETPNDRLVSNDDLNTHKKLVQTKRWQTCLGCHDFHGNHRMQTADSLEEVIKPKQINSYFKGARSPYSQNKYYKAKQKRNNGQDA